MAGYSSTPLAKKLGIKNGFRVGLINVPAHYFNLFEDLPEIEEVTYEKIKKDLIHYFVKEARELEPALKQLKKQIVPNGTIWVSWPKKASKVPTDITEDLIRDLALKTGLVDVKVCAVDEVWSGLKLVIPVRER